MYAVIRTGGKQYRVQEGDVIEVDHLSAKGSKLTFTPVLVVTDEGKTIYGQKDLKAYTVRATLVGDAKGDKVEVLKYRPKTRYMARSGHRQLYSLIEISAIGETGARPKAEAVADEHEAVATVDQPADAESEQ